MFNFPTHHPTYSCADTCSADTCGCGRVRTRVQRRGHGQDADGSATPLGVGACGRALRALGLILAAEGAPVLETALRVGAEALVEAEAQASGAALAKGTCAHVQVIRERRVAWDATGA